MKRPPVIGEIVCDCRYRHLAVVAVNPYDDDVELADGFHCSWAHCLDEVPHKWEHPAGMAGEIKE